VPSLILEVSVGLVALAVVALVVAGWFARAGGPETAGAFTRATPQPAHQGAGPSGGPAKGSPGRGSGVGAASKDEKQQLKAETTASGPSRHSDTQALAYFAWRWGADDPVIKRITDIRTVGGYLRIYTDLPESAGDSRPAVTLCEHGLDYLTKRLGRSDPVVFVQARFGENGNPVLANILGPHDGDCRVTHPAAAG
jgi:hypothetical protein